MSQRVDTLSKNDFVHLNVHTDYSLSDSILRFSEAVDRVKSDGGDAMAVSDVNNLFAAIRFYKKAKAEGIKPIVSSKLFVQDDLSEVDDGLAYPMVAIARDNDGYKHLCELSSRVFAEGQHGNHPHVKLSWLIERSKGLIFLSGGREGKLGRLIRDETRHMASKYVADMKQRLGENGFFIEVQRVGHPDDNDFVEAAAALSDHHQVPLVATNNVRFLEKNDFESHQIRVAIGKGVPLSQYERDYPCAYTPEQYLKSSKEMIALFDDIPEAVINTRKIADACNVEIELGNNYLPAFHTPNGMKESDFLKDQAREGLVQRIKKDHGVESVNVELFPQYFERLEYELNVINEMGFPGYFLIVSDFIQWAKDNDVPVGPGRGSGAGSLVAYALKITDLDPLKYDLLFERFLNPERVSMPDFDVDFCMDKRDRVIQYVSQKYGSRSVSQIVTFGTMAARSVILDVGRALGYSVGMARRIASMVPHDPGITLSQAREQSAEMDHLIKTDPEVYEIMSHAFKLEGTTRQTGKHAGGVLIAPGDLTKFTPTYSLPDGTGFVSQYDKGDVEDAGLVKFDFLGLRTLTIADWAVKFIKEKHDDGFDLLSIPLDDKNVLQMFARGETTAVFQVESRGMKELLRKLKPDCFEDLIALVALFRPGPLQSGMVDNFINRKHGREEISYPDPSYQHEMLKDILEPTYGIILYQEQVMQIAQALAGYSLGQADLLRRAMGKKKPEEMEKQRAIFAEGAKQQGVDEHLSLKIFDLVEKFAGYGFNKSHSAAYALISYQTAYLKYYYPAEFMSAVMTSIMHDTEKVVPFFKDSINLGIKIKTPSINKSQIAFTPVDGVIYYGLGGVKGFGPAYLTMMMKERERNGEYSSVYEWIRRTNPTKTVIEAAIKSGALDEFGLSRSTIADSFDKWKQRIKKEATSGSKQISIFGEENDPSLTVSESPRWPVRQMLQGERKTLGLFISGHPLDDSRSLVNKVISTTLYESMVHTSIDNESDLAEDRPVTVAGYIDSLDIKQGKKGSRATFNFDDGTAQIRAFVFPEAYHKNQHIIMPDATVVIKGKIVQDKRTKVDKLIAYEFENLDMLKDREISKVIFSCNDIEDAKRKLREISPEMNKCERGFTDIFYDHPQKGLVRIGSESVRVSDSFISKLKSIFGESNVEMEYRSDSAKCGSGRNIKDIGDSTRDERRKKISELFREAEISMGM